MDGAPGGEGRQGLLEAGSLLAGQPVAGRDDQAVRAGAEPPLDKLVEAGEIRHHFQTGVRDEEMYAVSTVAAARLREVSRAGGDDDHSSVAAGNDDPLEVCHSGSQRDLMDDDNFARSSPSPSMSAKPLFTMHRYAKKTILQEIFFPKLVATYIITCLYKCIMKLHRLFE